MEKSQKSIQQEHHHQKNSQNSSSQDRSDHARNQNQVIYEKKQEDGEAIMLRKMKQSELKKQRKERRRRFKEVKMEDGNIQNQPVIKFESVQEQQQVFVRASERQMTIVCPCGQRVGGPLHFFQHVQTKHKQDNLQQIYKVQQLKRIIENPDLSAQQCMVIESIDQHDFNKQLSKISRCYKRQEYVCKEFTQNQKQGGYGQIGQQMISELAQGEPQKWLILQFFFCVKHYVMRRWNRQRWLTGSPTQLFYLANHFFYYYRVVKRDLGAQFSPIKVCHIKRILYIFGKWMFERKMVDHRIVRVDGADLERDKEDQETLPVQEPLVQPEVKIQQ